MSDFVKLLNVEPFEVVRLVAALKQVESLCPYSDNNQIALMCSKEELEQGTLKEMVHGEATMQSRETVVVRHDEDYDQFVPHFADTYFKHVCDVLGIVRARLMNLKPKTGLTYHEDFHNRIHVPIITNRACFFMTNPFEESIDETGRIEGMQVHHLPANGRAFYLPTKQMHTVYNGGRTARIHLVGSLRND